jgi:hypothetical protein
VVETENDKDMIVRKENKMKKALAILLVLLVTGVAFGADEQLNLKANVAVQQGVILSLTDVTTVGDFVTANTGTPAVLDFVNATTKDFYLVLKTNSKVATTIGLSGSALTTGVASDPNIGYVISTATGTGYTRTADLTVPETATTSSMAFVADLGAFGTGNGMRVMSTKATITLDADEYAAASAANYTAQVVINIKTT